MATAKNLTWITTASPNNEFTDWLKKNHPDAILEEKPGVWTKVNPHYGYIKEAKEDEMERKRRCKTCRFDNQGGAYKPCIYCNNYDQWEAKEEKMDKRLREIWDDMEKFARGMGIGWNFHHDSCTNRMILRFEMNNFGKEYVIHGDGCNPNVEIANLTRDLTKFFKLDSPTSYSYLPSIKNVIFNDPATIVFWVDGTKTVVKAQDEAYDPEKGMAMAIAKKALGNQGNYCNVFKKWLPEKEEIEVKESTFIGTVTEHNIGPDGGVTLKGQIDGINANIIVKGIIE